MPKFNPELFKTLVLSFAYIHSKRRKVWCVYPLSEMPIYSSKLSQFANFIYFQFLVTRHGARRPQTMKTTTTLFQNPCNKIKLKNNPQIAKAKINI